MDIPDDAARRLPHASALEPGAGAEIDYDALADEVARDYPKILARLAD